MLEPASFRNTGAKIANLYETRSAKALFLIKKSKKGLAQGAQGCFSGKRGLRNVRKGEMKRKGFAAKEIFRNFAEN